MIRIVHVISDLDTGGAEVMLAKLALGMDKKRFTNTVISLIDGGPVGEAIKVAGIPVHSLGMKRGGPDPSGLLKLIWLLKRAKPHIVQSWLYHADFLSLLATPFAGSPLLAWNVRCSDMDYRQYPSLTRWTVRALALGSRRPTTVVVNSVAGQRLHQSLGYRARRWEMIPNGFDLTRFQPDAGAGQRIREELGIAPDTILMVMIARVDPMKDHPTFIAAAKRVAAVRDHVHFLLVGKDTQTLAPAVAEQGLESRVHLLGPRRDIDRFLPGVDIACLSSAFGEGFANVLGEAMACGVPCIATGVGDSRSIVGETGLVVPPRDPDALAEAMLDLIDRGRVGRGVLGRAGRARIEKEYALPKIVDRYQALYEDIYDHQL